MAVFLIMLLVVVAVTLLSCATDVRFMRIPNWHPLVILAAFVPAYLAAPAAFQGGFVQHLCAMLGMFAVTYAMFSFNMMGGGDAKLGSALGLWTGLKGLVPFLLFMAMMGGLLGVLTLVLRKKKLFKNPPADSWAGLAQKGVNAVPYGVAISFGFWMTLFYSGILHGLR